MSSTVNPFIVEPHYAKGFMDPSQTLKELRLAPNSTVVDFGCGSGYFSIPLAKILAEQGSVLAVDILEGPLEHLRSQVKIRNIHNLKTLRANLEAPKATKLEEGIVDVVLMANIIFQSSKPEAVVKEAHRILKTEGGRLIIIEWEPDKAPMPLGSKRIPKEEVQNMIIKQGFTVLREFSAGDSHYGMIFEKA